MRRRLWNRSSRRRFAFVHTKLPYNGSQAKSTGQRMDFGFSIPTRGPLATRDNLIALAKHGEALGFSYMAIPDHIVIPRKIDSPYPYNTQRKMVGASDGDCLEQVALMAYLSAVTSRLRLLTSIMVVPHRPAMLTAKALATIDVLSAGRVTVG